MAYYGQLKLDEFNKLVHMAHDRVAWSKLKSVWLLGHLI